MRTVADVVFLTFHYVSTHSSYNDVKPFVRAKSKCAPLAARSVPVARVCFSGEWLEMTVFEKALLVRIHQLGWFAILPPPLSFPVGCCFTCRILLSGIYVFHPSYLDHNVWATPELSLGVVDAAWKRGKWCQKKVQNCSEIVPKCLQNGPKSVQKCPKSGQWCQKSFKTR